VVIEPGVIAKWWARTRDAVVSDLAVHGLAYLGVVLMFAGVFGLFAFSMSDVQPVWRGVASLRADRLPRRRVVPAPSCATAVAAALSLLGGAIMPIAAIASLTDGSQIPPDLHGNALPIGQGVLCAAIAAATGFAARRWPASMLRFTAAPTLGLGVGVASGLLRDHIPSGEAVARPAALQMTAILVAAALTQVVLRRYRGSATLATATDTVLWPVAAFAYTIELVLAGTHGWPVASGVVAAVAAVTIVELNARRMPAHVTAMLQVALLVGGAARLAPDFQVEWIGVGMVALMLALAEYVGWRRPSVGGVAACLATAVAATAVTAAEPSAGIASAGVMMLWLLVRRTVTAEWLPMQLDEFGLAPAAASFMIAIEFWRITGDSTTLLTLAGVAVACAAGRRLWSVMERERMWWWWSPAVAIAVVAASTGQSWADERWVAAQPQPCARSRSPSADSTRPCAPGSLPGSPCGRWPISLRHST
jgi:hypothetical protein